MIRMLNPKELALINGGKKKRSLESRLWYAYGYGYGHKVSTAIKYGKYGYSERNY